MLRVAQKAVSQFRGEGRDGISRSPRMVAETGPGSMESVNRRTGRVGSQAVKEGDKSQAYCY